MALTAEQIKAREGRLTASRVACLMKGDKEAIHNLWREMIGDPDYEPDDLSGIWAVLLGATTEGINLDWYERKWGPITQRGVVRIGEPTWMACTLDGWDAARDIPVECKHVGGFESPDTVLARYQPQLHWIGIVTQRQQVAFSVIEGAKAPSVDFIDLDPGYSAVLVRRAGQFMQCVWQVRPPVELEPVTPPGPAVARIDMIGNNEWADKAGAWLESREGHKAYEKAKEGLKAMVPDNAGGAFGYGVEVKRSKTGALTVYPQRNK